QRQAFLLVKRRKPVGEQIGRVAILENAAGRIVPAGVRTFGIPPAVQLEVTNRQTALIELMEHAEQGARVTEVRLEMVVVRGAVIGPVPEFCQREIRVIWWPGFLVQSRQCVAPRIEQVIEPRS